MPVIFRGNIPPCCGWCAEVRHEADGVCWCYRTQKQISEVIPPYDKRMEWCPIEGEIPEIHGDIIDASVLFRKCQKHATEMWKEGDPGYAAFLEFMDIVKKTPVILKSENEQKRPY